MFHVFYVTYVKDQMEDENHIFIHCELANRLWFRMKKWCDLCFPYLYSVRQVTQEMDYYKMSKMQREVIYGFKTCFCLLICNSLYPSICKQVKKFHPFQKHEIQQDPKLSKNVFKSVKQLPVDKVKTFQKEIFF